MPLYPLSSCPTQKPFIPYFFFSCSFVWITGIPVRMVDQHYDCVWTRALAQHLLSFLPILLWYRSCSLRSIGSRYNPPIVDSRAEGEKDRTGTLRKKVYARSIRKIFMVARARLVILTITIKYRYSLFLQAWFTNSTFRRKEVPYTINGVKPLEGHIYLNTSSDHTSTYFRGDTRKGEKMRLCIINTKARQTKRGFWIRRRFSRLALGGMLPHCCYSALSR